MVAALANDSSVLGVLDAWREAGLIDEQTANRIREYEWRPGQPLQSRWPVMLTLSLGALLVALVAGFHVAGASLGSRSPAMSSTMHALGTVALGAGIALTGQIFNMAEHWPSAVLLWVIGAAAGYLLLRDWPQCALLAMIDEKSGLMASTRQGIVGNGLVELDERCRIGLGSI